MIKAQGRYKIPLFPTLVLFSDYIFTLTRMSVPTFNISYCNVPLIQPINIRRYCTPKRWQILHVLFLTIHHRPVLLLSLLLECSTVNVGSSLRWYLLVY